MDDGGPMIQEVLYVLNNFKQKRSYAGSLASLLECIDLYYDEAEGEGKKSRSSSPVIKQARISEAQSEGQIPSLPKDESNNLPLPPPVQFFSILNMFVTT